MLKNIFITAISVILFLASTGLTHSIHSCKMSDTRVQSFSGIEAGCGMDDGDCGDELSDASGGIAISEPIDACCSTATVGDRMQYDSSSPVLKPIINSFAIDAVLPSAEPVFGRGINFTFIQQINHSPPRDIPILFSNLLI